MPRVIRTSAFLIRAWRVLPLSLAYSQLALVRAARRVSVLARSCLSSPSCRSVAAAQPASRAAWLTGVLAVFLPIALVIVGAAAYVRQAELARLHAERADHGRAAVMAGRSAISGALKWAGGDLRYLVNEQKSQRLTDDADPSRLADVAAAWISFSNAKQVYDQIRWIDETGMERLRVNFQEPGPKRTPAGALQDKGGRYYFSDANNLGRGGIFVSPLDLNIDDGRIEVPHKPTIRLGAPVFAANGARRGIILLNYAADDMLNQLSRVSADAGKQAWLVNQDGYWLKGPQAADEWGFMLDRKEANMSVRYPDAWQRIRSAESGQFESAEGLWSFHTTFPLLEAGKAAFGNHEGPSAGRDMPDGRQFEWKVISLIPTEEYNAGMPGFDAKLAGGTLLLLIAFFLGARRLVGVQRTENALAAALSASNEQLRRLSSHEEEVRERERKYIARELHDELGQNLLAIRMELSSMNARIGGAQPSTQTERTGHLLRNLDATISSVRSMMNALRPATLELGLYAAVDWQLKQMERIRGIRCRLNAAEPDFDARMDEADTLVLFRSLQECLTNIVDHSHATEVEVTLQRDDRHITMRVVDNGIGMQAADRRKANSFGLVRVEERIRSYGGQLSVAGRAGQGTVLSISIPATTTTMH